MGYEGEIGVDYWVVLIYDGVGFVMICILNFGEGFIIVVNWLKGFVVEFLLVQWVQWFFCDNLGFVVGFIGLLGLCVYYYVLWDWVGCDFCKGMIFLRYELFEGFLLVVCWFIYCMGYDCKVFMVVVIDMVVKGFLCIEEEDGSY